MERASVTITGSSWGFREGDNVRSTRGNPEGNARLDGWHSEDRKRLSSGTSPPFLSLSTSWYHHPGIPVAGTESSACLIFSSVEFLCVRASWPTHFLFQVVGQLSMLWESALTTVFNIQPLTIPLSYLSSPHRPQDEYHYPLTYYLLTLPPW